MKQEQPSTPSGCPHSFRGDEAIERARILCSEVVGFDKPWALAIMRGLLGRIAELERAARSETKPRRLDVPRYYIMVTSDPSTKFEYPVIGGTGFCESPDGAWMRSHDVMKALGVV
jgi:hypothetical protein